MKKKALIFVLCLLSASALALGLTGCGEVEHTHQWETSLTQGTDTHWYACSGCDEKKDEVKHRYTDGVCVCGVKAPITGHIHQWAMTWSKDDTTHWYACSGCAKKKDEAKHSYTNGFCVCGQEEPLHTHDWATEWSKDGAKHWYACSGCNEIKDKETHSYTNGVCVCGQPQTVGLSYHPDGDGYTVTGIGSATDTDIVIPAVYEGKPVISIDSRAFSGCSGLTSIEIPNSVKSIGGGAFSGCSALEEITVPFAGESRKAASDTYQYPLGYIFGESSYEGGAATEQRYYGDSTSSTTSSTYYIPATLKKVTVTGGEILYGAFYNCSSLTRIEIPNSATSIGSQAFNGCSGLTGIEIPNSVTSIGNDAFNGCSKNLTSIQVDNGNPNYKSENNCLLTKDGKTLILGCKNSIIPNSVTGIGDSAFSGCGSLTSIEIPNSVTSIGDGAFQGCSSLTSIEIPNSVTSIGGSVCNGCSALEEITVPFAGEIRKTASDTYQYPLGYIFGESSYEGGVATEQRYYGDSTSSTTSSTYYIPATLKKVTVTVGEILYGAFYNCSSLTRIEIPNSATSIGEYAFCNCGSLTSIAIPNSVTSIGDKAFEGCGMLNAVYISALARWCEISFNHEHSNPLYYAHNLYLNGELVTDLVIPESVTSIGKDAFYSCRGLTTVVIPNSVTGIGKEAFSYCSQLTSIEIPNSVTSIGEYAFYGCRSLTSIEIPNSVTSIGSYAFYSCPIENATIPLNALTKILKTGFKTVVINGGESIESGAFSGCRSLASIEIPDSVTSIGDRAFENCSSLMSIEIPNNVTSIGDSMFSGCSSLTSVEIPNGVIRIGDSAFSGCSSLTRIEIPNGVTRIGDSVFLGCSSLTSIEIPNRVTRIGDRAFQGCSSLTSIEIPNNVTNIGDSAFSGCSALKEITVPFVGKRRSTASGTYQYPFGSIFGTSSYTGGTETWQPYYGESISFTTSSTYYIPTALKKVTVTGGEILYGAFSNCSSLTSIEIPNNVTSIGEGAFRYCSSLTSIEIPNSVTIIADGAFNGCSSLTSIEVPDGVTDIGAYAFCSCSNLSHAKIPDSVTSIGNSAFLGMAWYEDQPDGEVYVGKVFYEYKGTMPENTEIVIKEGTKGIADYAFNNRSSLASIEIPNSVTIIGNNAFEGCGRLTRIHFKGKKEQWNGISKGSSWNSYTGNYKVYCTDGTIDK